MTVSNGRNIVVDIGSLLMEEEDDDDRGVIRIQDFCLGGGSQWLIEQVLNYVKIFLTH